MDLIVLTGDNIASTTLIKPYARLAMHQYMSILEKLGTPVVMVYGNHDDERTTANKAYQMSVYENTSALSAAPARISARATWAHITCRSIPPPMKTRW